MKAPERWLTVAGGVALLSCLLIQWRCLPSACPPFCDISLRQAEIACSHEGVNPFRVWAHEVDSPRYAGHPRPDFPAQATPGKRPVHAYPPWHTAFCWFYGWLPAAACAALVSLLSALGLAAGVWWVANRVPRDRLLAAFALLGALFLVPASFAFWTGNYGLVLLGLFLAFLWCMERDRTVLAGLCWALMLIKPQVAALLFWPLLFRRRFTTIAVAGLVCALATLWPAAVYRESPLALILQIPEIGKPYLHVTAGTIPNAICALAGEGGVLAWGALCVLACAALSFLTRSAPCWLLRCVPALIVFPVWTYSQPHDLAIQLPLYALLLLAVFGKAPFPIPRWGRRLACVAVWSALFGRVFERAWQLANETRFVNLAGYDWLYIVVVHLALALASLACLTLAFFARPTPNPPHSSP